MFANHTAKSSDAQSFSNSAFGSSTAGATKKSGLSKSFGPADAQSKNISGNNTTGTFRLDINEESEDESQFGGDGDNNNNQDAEDYAEDERDEEPENELDAAMNQLIQRDIDATYNESFEENAKQSPESTEDNGDESFLNLHLKRQSTDFEEEAFQDLLRVTPAATKRMKREAESIAWASRTRPGKNDFHYAQICKDIYSQMDFADLSENESLEIILKTEEKITSLYDEGVGATDDEERLDASMATTAITLVNLWNTYASELPNPDEHETTIGPGLCAERFRKASWVAHLLLLTHHARFICEDSSNGEPVPLPESLFGWLETEHNPYRHQFRDVLTFEPSPASHSQFWQTLHAVLIRGQINQAIELLSSAGWEQAQKRSGTYEYTGRVLENIKKAIQDTIEMLYECPGRTGNWNIWAPEWTLFRVKARSAWERLSRFAEGRGRAQPAFGDGFYSNDADSSMTTLSRKAESLVPWEIYQQLSSLFQIVKGEPDAILQVAQDWLEASVGLCGWWNHDNDRRQSSLFPRNMTQQELYAERLCEAFHLAVDSEFELNTLNHCEMAAAAIFEGNYTAAIGFMRCWSLPVASAAAEIGSLAHWLPKRETRAPRAMEDFDEMDLEVLGMTKQGPDEIDGMKDTTLVMYARELAGIELITPDEYGWEMATRVLGRLDSVPRAEETIRELLHDVLDNIDVDSGSSVERVWRILVDLGMNNFAQESAEAFADLLSRDSHKYGEALWYYALAHKPQKVREVLNLLTAYSLLQSTIFPPEAELDDRLDSLLSNRSATLQLLAKQDVEAAQLLGRMFSGYATLRKFYQTRDLVISAPRRSARAFAIQRQAAAALVAVIASADDNIRGGTYDAARDAVVSEDFLLALLGEALVLVNSTQPADPVLITAAQMDVLLKAIEDLQTVGGRVYASCNDFFNVVLAATPGGLKGSKPTDLLASTASGSLAMSTSSSMIASQLQRAISGSSSSGSGADGFAAAGAADVVRGWDWRTGLTGTTTAEDVLRILRLGLSKDLAKLWLMDVDDIATF
ncbi:hypothetical protein TD95_000697 [Thielaviopsis punctulata]|uniref:Nuclear pore complex protein Nup85 n=1 Tax=Thielaviopsis punctulata TaxID=72032 RepID=A0A0F4ZGD1_9PEZI|nr:hypothetical protein TD95_000697 [Thielaviopsis punctulata]